MGRRSSKSWRRLTGEVLVGAALAGWPGAAPATDFGTFDGFDVRWDNTLRATLGLRTESADPGLLANVNGDDGDRAFNPGLISDRIDVLSEIEVARDDLGFDASADGWYDGVYHGRSANNSPATFNPLSVPNTQFPAGTRSLDGGMVELLDAYAFARFTPGDVPVSVRVGRQTLLWGEGFFFPGNSIAGTQSPVDAIKSLGQPLAENREILLPVTQASVRVGLPDGFSVEAYVQAEWRRDRLPGVASYFSTTDYLDVGGERLFAGNPIGGGSAGGGPVPGGGYAGVAIHGGAASTDVPSLLRGHDRAPSGLGQFGLALRQSSGGWDFGLYALRFAAKLPELYYATLPKPAYNVLGQYGLDFPRGIQLYGASASRSWGAFNLAGEVSARVGMPLLSATPPLRAPADEAVFAAGTTLHADLSLDAVLPPSRLWNGADWIAELAANELADVTHSAAALLPGRTRFAAALRTAFTPDYYEIAPNIDIALPLGLGLGLVGRSAIDSTFTAGAGDVEAGISATYRRRWQAALQFTHFIGGGGAQRLADRDFVTLAVTRTF